jgi:hypothetical protein
MVLLGPQGELPKQGENLIGQFLLFYRKPLSKCVERGFYCLEGWPYGICQEGSKLMEKGNFGD